MATNTTGLKSLDKLAADPRVDEVRDERESGNGIWVYLKHGWRVYDMTIAIHGESARDVLSQVTGIEKGCTESPCGECGWVAPA